MRKITLVIAIIGSMIFFTSCVGNKKLARLNKAIEGQKNLETKLDSTLTVLTNFREDKNSRGELDDTSNLAIKRLLDKEAAETKRRIDSISEVQKKIAAKRPKVKEYKNMITVMTTGTSIVDEKMETVSFVDQLLKQETFIKFNTAAFFPPGGYRIPADKISDAKVVFSPLVDSLIAFVQRFPKMTLVSSIVASGYADGSGFAPGPLVDTLSSVLGKANAPKEELNMVLSRIRAEEVANILTDIFRDKVKNLPASSSLNTRFFKTGKGEEYPNKKIKNYTVDDERRRIVVIYWNALPDVK